MSITTSSTQRALAFCTTFGLLAAGCGDSSSSTTGAPSASAPSSAKPAMTTTASGSGSAAALPVPGGPLPPVPFKPPTAGKLGDKDVSAEACKLDPSGPTMWNDSFDKAIRGVAAAGSNVYVLDDHGRLRKYTTTKSGPCDLKLDKAFGQNGILALNADEKKSEEFDTLAIDPKGDLYVSGFIANPVKVSGGQVSPICDKTGRLFVDSKSGAAYFDSNQVDLAGGCKPTPFKAKVGKDEGAPSPIVPVGADVAGAVYTKVKDKNIYKIGLFSAAGDKKFIVGEADGDGQMCNIGSITSCAQGLCVVDANCRGLKAFDSTGKMLGSIKIGTLIGLSYPWPRALFVGADGAYLAATHSAEKSEDKRQYGIVFRITGLQ